MTRCFLGFELTDASRAYLRERLVPLQRVLADELGWPVRLVPPDNWHATLLFFAGLEAPEREAVWQAVARDAAAGTWAALDFAWRGLMPWPGPRRPGLLCVEAERHEAVAGWPLLARLDAAPWNKGETGHLRAYVPHITVMRFRKVRGRRLPGARDWAAAQERMPAIDCAALRFDRLSFFLSTVSPQAPIYPRERTVALQP